MKARKLLVLLIAISCIFAFAGCNNYTVMSRLKMYGVDTELLSDGKVVCDVDGKTFTGRSTCYGVIAFS